VIEPSCPHGYTRVDLAIILGERLAGFDRWMNGQTMMLCEGRLYDYEAKEYRPDACADDPHGVVAYPRDLRQYLRGGRPLD
jgi:hypothetical protein